MEDNTGSRLFAFRGRGRQTNGHVNGSLSNGHRAGPSNASTNNQDDASLPRLSRAPRQPTAAVNDDETGLATEMGPRGFAGEDLVPIPPSVLDYPFENGRRYHAAHAGAYHLPNDDREQEREFVIYKLFCLLRPTLHVSPLSDDPRCILDIGTGTGQWVIDSEFSFLLRSSFANPRLTVFSGRQIPICEYYWRRPVPYST